MSYWKKKGENRNRKGFVLICIRADANEMIATGHIMRCSAIAEALVREGGEVCFVVADGYGEELVKKLGFPCLVLNSSWQDMEGELTTLKAVLHQEKPELVLVDSYYVTEAYFDALKGIVKTAYIDDYLGKRLSCDILINYDLEAGLQNYAGFDDSTVFLLGGEYTPLRKQFGNQKARIIEDEISEILVLAGGSDHFHVVYNICKALISRKKDIDDCVVNIACGRYNDDYDDIVRLTVGHPNLKIYRSIDDIDVFMKRADACISAGGTTTKELAACGTPSITYSVADNQLEGVRSLDRAGLMKYIGDVRNEGFSYDTLVNEMLLLCKDKERRTRESALLQRTIDGMGAMRIARELLK